jgi:hypothetical protein
MGRHNVNKYIYVFGRVDAAADRFEPGGFKHVIAEVEAQKPVLFALGRFKLRKFASRANFKLLDQMTGQYIALKRCPALLSGLYMVRSDRADQLFPPGAGGCLTRS